MPTITREELRRRLKQGRIEPLYLLYGAEDYLRDRAAHAITEAALKDASLREFNEARFSLTTRDAQEAIGTAEQLPMMSARRVVRITDFGKLRESDEEAIARYVARPSETTTLLFVADDLDKRRKLSKTLLDGCTAVEFARLTEAELMAWARQVLKELHVEADDRTLGHTIALVGASARRLSNELNKLATAALPEGRITIELVDALVNRSGELSNFELNDDLLARNRVRALATLRILLDDGAEPLMLLGLIASHFRRLSLAKALMARGAPKEQVFSKVGIAFSKREEFLASARRADAASLERAIHLCAAADLGIKTSLGTPRLQLEMLVCEVTDAALAV